MHGLRRTTTAAALAAGLAAVGGVPAVATGPAAAPASSAAGYDPAMVRALAGSLGSTPDGAVRLLEAQHREASALEGIERSGVRTDGAYYRGATLVVNVDLAEDARATRAAGLEPRYAARGQSDLAALMPAVARAVGDDVDQVQSYGPDLEAQKVVVTLAPGAGATLGGRLRALDGVAVRTGTPGGLAPTADVVPGQIMDLSPGTNCSLGFPGETADGDNVLLTAGHCVEGLPDVLDSGGTHIGVGVETRFRTGRPSVDMGLMDIDTEDVGRGFVDTRAGDTVPVSGLSRAPVGSAICKAGNTTGWTCGEISRYGVTVNYQGGTRTTGLAESTVCTEGGDSGGAYISGSLAQGMTSGGPVTGPDCGFSPGDSPPGSLSYYQPVDDAAEFYGVTLTTS